MANETEPTNVGDVAPKGDPGTNSTSDSDNFDPSSMNIDAKAINARLLKESKKHREKYLAAQSELDNLKKEKLESQGEYKKMAELALQKYQDAEARYNTLKQSLYHQNVRAALAEVAAKAGAILPAEDLLRIGKSDVIVFDEDTQVVHGVELFLDDLKKNKPGLFSQVKPPVVNPAQPGGVITQKKLTAMDIAKLPHAERMQVLLKMRQSQNK